MSVEHHLNFSEIKLVQSLQNSIIKESFDVAQRILTVKDLMLKNARKFEHFGE
jgi:hypothetical protein